MATIASTTCFFINALPPLYHTMQLLIDNYLEDHRLPIQAYITSKPIHRLLEPMIYFSKSPYRVSSRSLGLRLYLRASMEFNKWFTESNRMIQKNEFPLILAKGEPVLERHVIKRFLLNPQLNLNTEYAIHTDILAIDDDATVMRYSDGNSVLVDPSLASTIRLYQNDRMNVKDDMNIVVVVGFQNYASAIKMWIEFEDYDLNKDGNQYLIESENIAEPLTVAYI